MSAFGRKARESSFTRSISGFDPRRSSIQLFLPGANLVPGQVGAIDGLLHQPQGLSLFNKFTGVGESRGLTLRHHHAEEIGPVGVVQYARAGKLCGIRQKHSTNGGKRVRLSRTQEFESRFGGLPRKPAGRS